MPEPKASFGVRQAELLATLSLATDLGLNQPMEHIMRTTLIALQLAEQVGMSEDERSGLYSASLIAWVGCHIDAYEQAKWFGDDTVLKGDVRRVDVGRTLPSAAFTIKHLGAGRPFHARVRLGLSLRDGGWVRAMDQMLENHWLASRHLTLELGLGQPVLDVVEQTFERWDGKGYPGELAGEELRLASRLINLADVVEVFHRSAGEDAAVAVARERSGTQFDPELVERFCGDAEALLSDLDAATTWDEVISAEPGLTPRLVGERLDAALGTVGDFVDLKSPYTLGHSRGVAELGYRAALDQGLPESEAAAVRRAAHVHDLGRLGVSNTIWDKPGPLAPAEMERVRLHPYLSERMLAFSPDLAALAEIAGQHHERMDGSGYPRGLTGEAISFEARLLGAADCYHALTEPRPHRPELARDEAAAALRDEIRAGRLDSDAAGAVLRAAGHVVRRRRDWPCGLTSREVEVLRLLARGLSNREIAERLVISPGTAGRHAENIYGKLGVRNRAQAGLFAVKHGLVAVHQAPAD